jgi:hypothetical protein
MNAKVVEIDRIQTMTASSAFRGAQARAANRGTKAIKPEYRWPAASARPHSRVDSEGRDAQE